MQNSRRSSLRSQDGYSTKACRDALPVAAMTMVMAVPAMPMPVADLDDYLRIRCRYQRCEEQKGE